MTTSERLSAMLDILTCPVTGSQLTLEGDFLVAADGKRKYPVINGIPQLHPNAAITDAEDA